MSTIILIIFNKLTGLFYTEYTDTEDILDKYKDEIESIKYYVASEMLFEGQYLPIIKKGADTNGTKLSLFSLIFTSVRNDFHFMPWSC